MGFRDWPLTAKVIVLLALVLAPLGLFAVVAAIHNYDAAVPLGTEPALTPTQAMSITLPVLMWLAALAIGWLVANRLIVDPLVRLRVAVESFHKGDRTIRLGNETFFSREITALANAFDVLADDIATHDAEIEEALIEQKRLTREVHHRVKNNLQIVSSLLSLQARDASSGEVAHAYAVIQARVAALAIVHRWMYDSEAPGGGPAVDLKALVNDLAAGLEQSLASTEQVAVSITATIERLFIGQDTAVPLAFLITELVSCAARAGAPEPLAATLTAISDKGQAVLRIAAPAFVGADDLGAAGGLPASRIITGMARQLRAPLLHDPDAGSYCIAFPLPAPVSPTG